MCSKSRINVTHLLLCLNPHERRSSMALQVIRKGDRVESFFEEKIIAAWVVEVEPDKTTLHTPTQNTYMYIHATTQHNIIQHAAATRSSSRRRFASRLGSHRQRGFLLLCTQPLLLRVENSSTAHAIWVACQGRSEALPPAMSVCVTYFTHK